MRSIPKLGYFISWEPNQEAWTPYAHYFCGMHSINGAWCSNCQKPLLRLLKLNARDPRLRLDETGLEALPLLFCWTCNIAQGDFQYRIIAENSVEILVERRGRECDDFPYSDYPHSFPGTPVQLIALTDMEQRVLKWLNSGEADINAVFDARPDLCAPRHQVGGVPYLVQGSYVMRCANCKSKMPFLATIVDACLDPRGIIGSSDSQVIFQFCRKCLVVGAYQRAD